jgi:SAM-dependent methyltransferase
MIEPATNYEELAADYALHRRVHPGVLQWLLARIATVPDARVLEVGCGSGNYLEAMSSLSHANVAGVDPSPAMLDQLRRRLPLAHVVEASGESLPFEAAAFDVVYSVDVIHHVGDRLAYFGEAFRVLRPGGLLITVTDSEEDLRRRVPLTSHFPETLPHELRRYPTIPTLQQEMATAGFQAIGDDHAEHRYALTDRAQYQVKAFSSLHRLTDDEHAAGMARIDADLARGPIDACSLYTLVFGSKPAS